MRFGCCVNMIAQDPHGIGAHWIETLAALGFDYVDLPMAQMMELSDGDFERLVLAPLKASELPCVCTNNLFPASLRLTGPDADHAAALSYAERAFTRAEMLGATRAVFGSSGARNLPPFWRHEDGTAQLAALLHSLAPLAAQHGVTLVIEPLNRGESNILTSLSEGAALCRALDDPAVRMLADTYHMALSGENAESLRVVRGLLRHVHIACPLGRVMPSAGDGVDYAAFFSALRAIGYDGEITIEAYAPCDTEKTLGATLAYLRAQDQD